MKLERKTTMAAAPIVIVIAFAVLAVVAWLRFGTHAKVAVQHARTGTATVTIYDDGEPVRDRFVVFHDADGKPTSSTKSDSKGRASAEISAGSMITVAYGTSNRHLVTVTAVEPGDDITIGEKEDEGGEAKTVKTARVRVPGAYPGANRHTVSLGVGATEVSRVGEPLPMPVVRRFVVDDTKFRVLGEALAPSGEPLAFAFAWGQLAHSDVKLPAWSTDFRDQSFLLANAPPGLTSAAVELALLAGEEDRFDRGRREASVAQQPHGETTVRFPVPRPLGTGAEYKIELRYGASPDTAILVRRSATTPERVRVSLRDELLPRVSGVAVEGDRSARPTVRWNVAGDASKADVSVVRVAWPATREQVWTVTAPPGRAPHVRLPALPAELASWAPDGRPLQAAVALADTSFYGGYADVRRKGLALLSEPPENDEGVSVTMSVSGDLMF